MSHCSLKSLQGFNEKENHHCSTAVSWETQTKIYLKDFKYITYIFLMENENYVFVIQILLNWLLNLSNYFATDRKKTFQFCFHYFIDIGKTGSEVEVELVRVYVLKQICYHFQNCCSTEYWSWFDKFGLLRHFYIQYRIMTILYYFKSEIHPFIIKICQRCFLNLN